MADYHIDVVTDAAGWRVHRVIETVDETATVLAPCLTAECAERVLHALQCEQRSAPLVRFLRRLANQPVYRTDPIAYDHAVHEAARLLIDYDAGLSRDARDAWKDLRR